VNRTHLTGLFTGLFDDAALYPPADTKLPDAVRDHARHRLSWYAETLGPFVCDVRRLPALATEAKRRALEPFDVAVTVPGGIDDLTMLTATTTVTPGLRVRAVELPLKQARLGVAVAALRSLCERDVACYVEIPVATVREDQVHELRRAGLRLKLRTGGTSIDAFSTESELATALVRCAAERLAFKCTAGLHNAVRHRDPQTAFEHHGFLNVALAARVAASTGSDSATVRTLGERDPVEVAARTAALTADDVAAIRAVFASFGTCSVTEPLDDLVAMGLVTRP
jgi:hypothetical protein